MISTILVLFAIISLVLAFLCFWGAQKNPKSSRDFIRFGAAALAFSGAALAGVLKLNT